MAEEAADHFQRGIAGDKLEREDVAQVNEHLFTSLRDARDMIPALRDEYNQHRPHKSLDGLTPWEFLNQSI